MKKSIIARIILLLILILPFILIMEFAIDKEFLVSTASGAKLIKRSLSTQKLKPEKKQIIARHDLSILNMKWSYPLKQGYIVGQNSILNFTLKNKGTVPSGDFTIRFKCPNGPLSMTGVRTIPSMAPGQVVTHNWPSVPSVPQTWSAGSYFIEAVVDPNRQIIDSNRTNNRKILMFKVKGSPVSKTQLKLTDVPVTSGSLSKITAGKRISSGFNFSKTPKPGTTGKRVVSGFDFSTQASPGTTGRRIVTGFNFSTQPIPGATGTRTVQGFNFTKQ